MKKLPYASCFIVVQINKQIKKFYFNEVIDYKDYSNPDFEEHVRETLTTPGGEYGQPDIDDLIDEHIGDFGAHIETLMKKPK